MKQLITTRLRLRAWQPTDAEYLLSLESLPEIVRFLGRDARTMATIEEAKASIQRRRSITTQGQGIWAVEERTSAKLVGNLLCKPVGITHQDGSAIIEIGWHLHPSAQGNGYATEAAEAVIDYAQSCGVDTISAFVDPLNIASVKVCERLGMTLQVLPKHVYGQQMLHFQVMKKSPKLQDNY